MIDRVDLLHKMMITILVLFTVFMFGACSNPPGGEDDVLTLSDILSDFAGTYYYYPTPLNYGFGMEMWEITTSSSTFTLDVSTAQYQKSYAWMLDTNSPYTFTVSGFTEQSSPHAIILDVADSDTNIAIYDDGHFVLDYGNGTNKTFYTELEPANDPHLAYDINDQDLFDGGFWKIWYCAQLANINKFWAYKMDYVVDNSFDMRDQEYDGSDWGSVTSTVNQHISITNVNPNINASLYYGVYTDDSSTEYITVEFFSESRADLTYYTDSSYTTVKKLGGLFEMIYEMYSDPAELGVSQTIFM